MNKDNIVTCIMISILFALVGFMLGAVFVSSLFNDKFQREAIKKGHAVWSTNENGYPVFQWKEVTK
jgi:hypothetical protein